jgi:hypothetical protein
MRSIPFIAAAFATLTLAGCEAPTSHLDAHELGVAAQQVESLAGEGEWLAQQLRTGSVPESMAWVHQQAIGEDAAQVAKQLTKPVPRALRPDHETIVLLNARLRAQAGRIADAAAHPDELAALEREFHTLADQARPIGHKT